MRNIFRELIEKEKQIVELSNELQETKELLNFSLDDSTEKVKEIKEIEKTLFRNNYNNTESKLRKAKEQVKDLRKEMEQ